MVCASPAPLPIVTTARGAVSELPREKVGLVAVQILTNGGCYCTVRGDLCLDQSKLCIQVIILSNEVSLLQESLKKQINHSNFNMALLPFNKWVF